MVSLKRIQQLSFPMSKDYKDTVFLPKTAFSMKANLAEKEPQLIAYWQNMGLYGLLREQSRGRSKFVLHDGPAYANGHLHMGHALNKTLKDVIIRAQQMLGKDAPFVPGWDCHGLPIEAKVEENYRLQKLSKDDVSPQQFRKECRAYAAHWIDVQRQEIQRLGCLGRWEKPYTTMDFASEAQIVRELGTFLHNGSLYLGVKPIMWSVVEKTALAEAEIEYHDKAAQAIYLGFPIVSSPWQDLVGVRVIIWTTTPWTLPANRAVAYSDESGYSLIQSGKEAFLVATERLEGVVTKLGLEAYTVLKTLQGHELAGSVCAHPLSDHGYGFAVPLLPGEHVTTDAGTGFVHIAPGHGLEDFALAKHFDLEVPYTVNDDGTYADHVPIFAGTHIFKAADNVMPALRATGLVFAEEQIVHSYPHSWRSKAPLIFRTTPQWFISMETTGLRQKALSAIQTVTWHPAVSRNRIQSMVENRPDWCVSRQRAWGVPITVFIHKKTQQPLKDPLLFEKIAAAIESEGTDLWFENPAERFLPPAYNPAEYEPVRDILDVWFDSGSTHGFVLEKEEELHWPSTLYLEGSDQHRGWFQSSLMVACGTRGAAPFRNVLTHGFIVDELGRKMSKSAGNTVNLEDVLHKHGADILRLWAVSSDYTEDLRIGKNILQQQEDIYRRFRNTFRYLLGSLDGFSPEDALPYAELPELERWVLSRLFALDQVQRQCHETFNYQQLIAEIHAFCASDLSAFYFDIRKDSLYCDGRDSLPRRAVLTALHMLFECLTTWLAPILCFTAEEAWLSRYPKDQSVHLALFPILPLTWKSAPLEEKMVRIRNLRRVMTGALEAKRAEGLIGSSLQATLNIHGQPDVFEGLEDVDWAAFSIASQVVFKTMEGGERLFSLQDVCGVAVEVVRAEGEKCQRCWKVLPEVGQRHPDLCYRCEDVVSCN